MLKKNMRCHGSGLGSQTQSLRAETSERGPRVVPSLNGASVAHVVGLRRGSPSGLTFLRHVGLLTGLVALLHLDVVPRVLKVQLPYKDLPAPLVPNGDAYPYPGSSCGSASPRRSRSTPRVLLHGFLIMTEVVSNGRCRHLRCRVGGAMRRASGLARDRTTWADKSREYAAMVLVKQAAP